MVSSSLGMEPEELLAALAEIRDRLQDDPEYQAIRKDLPEDWPL